VALIAFVASQLALIALGSVPVRFWQSFKGIATVRWSALR
jgi:hypothetical protein